MLLPQLFFPGVLEIRHAVFESLNLLLTQTPVLVFSHALLDRVMEVSTAGAGYHLIHGVILIVIIFTAAVMGGRRCHRVSVEDIHISSYACIYFSIPHSNFTVLILFIYFFASKCCK